MLDMLRLFSIGHVLDLMKGEHGEKLGSIIMTVLALVISMTGVIQLVDNYSADAGLMDPTHSYGECFFFVMTTISTIGYESILLTDPA